MYLNLVELAESFGVSERVVEDWIRDQGLPHVLDRSRVLFDRASVAHWAAEHGLAARAGFLAPQTNAFAGGMTLAAMLRSGGVHRQVDPSQVISLIERAITGLPHVSPSTRALLFQRLRAQGGINWAPVGKGFALPHFSSRVTLGRDAGLILLLLLRSSIPLPEGAPDSVPVTRLFFFVPPSPRAHLDTLARLSRVVAGGVLAELLEQGATDEALFAALERSAP